MKRLLIGMTFVAAVASGCANLERLAMRPPAPTRAMASPTISFQREAVSRRTLFGSTLDLTFRIHHPSGESVSVEGVRYTLTANGKTLFHGSPSVAPSTSNPGFLELHLPTEIRFAEVGPAAEGVRSIPYRGEGTVQVRTPNGTVTLPFQHAGRLQRPRLPQLQVQIPEVAGIQLPSANIVIPLRMTHDEPFPFTLTGVGGNVTVDGAPVGHVSIPENLTIQPGSSPQTLRIPVRISYLELANAALSGKVSKLAFEGTLKVGEGTVPFSFNVAIPLHLQPPRVSFALPRVEHVGLTSATVVFPIQVENSNDYPLPLGKLLGAIQLEGSSVGKVSTLSLGVVPGKKTTKVEVPITIDLLGAARSLLGGDPVSMGFKGRIQTASTAVPVSFSQRLPLRR